MDEEFRGKCTDSLMEQLTEAEQALNAGHDVAIVINGVALEAALKDEEEKGRGERGLFLQVATRCRTVICCRLFPADKSQVQHPPRPPRPRSCVPLLPSCLALPPCHPHSAPT